MTLHSRRSFLRGSATAATAGLAGCSGFFGGGSGLTVAYMPIYPDMQHFVMDQEGYYDEIDAEITAREFTDGPSIVKAYASGEIDVAMFGIVPAMIVLDRGIEARVVAANIEEPMAIMTRDEFQSYWEAADDAKAAFRDWKADNGTFTFGTFPSGSVPDILLRYWLQSVHDIDPATFDAVEITGVGGASAVFSALASGNVDGTSIMEWVPTKVEREGLPYGTLVRSGEFMPGQPAAVTLMDESLLGEDVATQFVRQHRRATRFIEEHPAAAAADASAVVGESLPTETAREALRSPLSNFVTDPHRIEDGTEIFASYAAALGKTDRELSVDDIFDYSVYDGL
jgi:NitT/TauT family transport system substrate-binding protein